MAKSNMADTDYPTDDENIFGYNNVEMTSEEALEVVGWLNDRCNEAEAAEISRPVIETIQLLSSLIELVYNLGQGHFQDTQEAVNVIVAAEYMLPEPRDEVDPKEDAEEEIEDVDETTKAETGDAAS